MRPINTEKLAAYIQKKSVFDLKLLFVNHTMQSYNLDLLTLVEMNPLDPYDDVILGDDYQVFKTCLPEKF